MSLLKEMEGTKSNYLELEKNLEEALKDKEFSSLVSSLKLEKKEIMKKTSKLQSALEEKKKCLNCKGFFMCENSYPGYLVVPNKKYDKLYFTYMPCKYQKQILEAEEKKHAKIKMKDIDTNDKNQLKVIKWMDDFYENYNVLESPKGLYLHGSFGSGKTYLITALLQELESSRNASIEIVYFPDFLRFLKDDFDLMGAKMNRIMNVDILLLDDIGAEKVTDWGRDEVLGVILQSRMENKKTTFFTSNLTIDELEQNLSITKNSVDKVKSRRIIERVKQLTTDMELISENRRK